ncbi:uncharacterized protein EV420DRAFT_1517847 [Desarmillaria tabescens]|uniref:Uncharacterized protein n=1 Tax=Armillaria tabescens TaxID=1929756 RepID=A0AA39NFJ4_ARMTA|nr:uncharacterized protein EV420DRAFT_1517847 [Desarmillaria tabescens]KAK0464722.1 hypothetical protein EV420DRAFT_1517847 [Desarmillaria tabescens]
MVAKGSWILLLISNCHAPVFRFCWLQLIRCLIGLLYLICYQGTPCFGHDGGACAQLLPFLVLYWRSVIFNALEAIRAYGASCGRLCFTLFKSGMIVCVR